MTNEGQREGACSKWAISGIAAGATGGSHTEGGSGRGKEARMEGWRRGKTRVDTA